MKAEKFDQQFDDGKDLTAVLDLSKAKRTLQTENTCMTKTLHPYPRPQRGSGLDDFLKEDGIFEEVQVHAIKRVLVEQFDDAIQKSNLTKAATAQQLELDK